MCITLISLLLLYTLRKELMLINHHLLLMILLGCIIFFHKLLHWTVYCSNNRIKTVICLTSNTQFNYGYKKSIVMVLRKV